MFDFGDHLVPCLLPIEAAAAIAAGMNRFENVSIISELDTL